MKSDWKTAVHKERGLRLESRPYSASASVEIYAVLGEHPYSVEPRVDYDYIARVEEKRQLVRVSLRALKEHPRRVEKVLSILYGKGRFTVKGGWVYYRGNRLTVPFHKQGSIPYCVVLPYPFPEKTIWLMHKAG